ncbi:unnamed protein product, partial [Closterium sp. Naga37s-1]
AFPRLSAHCRGAASPLELPNSLLTCLVTCPLLLLPLQRHLSNQAILETFLQSFASLPVSQLNQQVSSNTPLCRFIVSFLF